MSAEGGDRLDVELRERFAALRRQETEAAPGFGEIIDRARAKRRRDRHAGATGGIGGIGGRAGRGGSVPARRLRLAALGALTMVLALAALLAITRPWAGTRGLQPAASRARPRPVPLLTAWRSPTDFLLRTPGSEILSATPSLGSDLFLGLEAAPWPPRTPKHRPESYL
jgi:hypothetical protein